MKQNLHKGTIKAEDFDLQETLESGQTFLWSKNNGTLFGDRKSGVYYTTDFLEYPIFIEIRQDKDEILWKSNNSDVEELIKTRLGLHHNIEKIENHIIDRDTNGVMKKSIEKHKGLRIVNEPLFPTLISFICSTQMRVKRIHNMVKNIRQEFGKKIQFRNKSYFTFPRSKELSKATEQNLKNLKLGYRARYVKKTSDKVSSIDNLNIPPDREEAREKIKQFTGVGTKVADCVILYGTDRKDVVPIDTWMDKAVNKYYNNIHYKSNEETARAFEQKFGKYSGYAQAYLFHYIRTKNS